MIAAVEWLGYRRVSRVGGREHLISPELQADRIGGHAEVRGLSVRMLPPELDVSGGKRSRPILDSAIAAVERGEAAGVIVSDLDRLEREQAETALQRAEAELAAYQRATALPAHPTPPSSSWRACAGRLKVPLTSSLTPVSLPDRWQPPTERRPP